MLEAANGLSGTTVLILGASPYIAQKDWNSYSAERDMFNLGL